MSVTRLVLVEILKSTLRTVRSYEVAGYGRACIFLLIVWAFSLRSGRLSVSIVAKER